MRGRISTFEKSLIHTKSLVSQNVSVKKVFRQSKLLCRFQRAYTQKKFCADKESLKCCRKLSHSYQPTSNDVRFSSLRKRPTASIKELKNQTEWKLSFLKKTDMDAKQQ